MNPDLKKRISYDSIKIEPIREEHVQPSIELWTAQFKNVKNTVQDITGKWITDLTAIRLFLEEHAETGKGIVAKTYGDVIGYMVYDSLLFHGADTVYCPIMGHASVESGRARIYQEMYRNLSDVWVRDAVLDHIVTFFSLDVQLKRVLFNLGFDELGAYIQPSCRGHGIGARLLSYVLEWCREQRIDHIHVDYESANLYASGFWSKYFTPTMYSVRRRVNPDILHGRTP